jgi:UDP-N-acetyl-D-galactosamine dehydrogenase
LVGGHCIGVDPYYLTHKAESLGYYPQVILAGRRINDNMACFAASRLIKQMIRRKIEVDSSKVLILGLTFKENCPDLRNTKVIDMINELKDYQVMVDVCDPWADAHAARKEYGIDLVETPDAASYDAIVIAVAHRQFSEMGAAGLRKYGKDKHVMFDLKYVFSKDESDFRL